MAHPEAAHANRAVPKKPRILLAATGTPAAMKFALLCRQFCEFAEVLAIATRPALHFIDRSVLPKNVPLFTDADDWLNWKKADDRVLHIELCRWADILVIAPLSANTLAKIAEGLCDNLLTCIIRAWDSSKRIFVAPSMNKYFWSNSFTNRHLKVIDEELGISLIPPATTSETGKDYGTGIMPEINDIYGAVRIFVGWNP